VDNVIHWEVIENLERMKSDVHSFSVGNIKFKITLDNYIIFQYFQGSNLTIIPIHAYIYLVVLFLSINLIMAILPSLNKFWFYAGMGGFIGFMVLFNLGHIGLFNQSDKSALIIILGLYLSAGYYFREFKPDIPIATRFFVFTAISIVIAILFNRYASVEHPFLHLANNGIYGPVIISIVFILTIAHEIIYGLLFLTTNASIPTSKNSLVHFVLITLLYLFYVIITYLYYSRQIYWNLVYLNPFLVLIVAVIIGLWSFRKREELYAEIFPFYPVGGLFYLSFASITIMTIAYVFSSGNDPMIEAFEDAILYSQIGFGILFFIYIIANFGPLIAKNYRVIKIVYQSRILPFFVFRIGGVIAAGFLFFQAEFFPYYQILAGYFNQVGDLYLIEDQLDLAREYYDQASDYEYQNHRSNYAMATIGRLQKDKLDEAYYFENSLLKRPTEYAYVNLANVYLRNNQYFEGLFKIKEGESQFPLSSQILNNLGYFYSKTDIIDTALYYFNLANNATRKHAVPIGNIYGTLAKSGLYISLDSLSKYYSSDDPITNINQQALLNFTQHHEPALIDRNTEFIQNDVDFASVYNSGLNALRSSDTIYFNLITEYRDSTNNGFYQNRLDILRAVHYYFTHRTEKAFQILNTYANISLNKDEYYRLLGKLALEHDVPRISAEFFEKTNIVASDEDYLNLTMARLEAGDYAIALENFQQLKQSDNADIVRIAEEYTSVLTYQDSANLEQLNDEFIYLLFRYHSAYQENIIKERLVDRVSDSSIKNLMRCEYIESLIVQNSIAEAETLFKKWQLSMEDKQLGKRQEKIAYLLDIKSRKHTKFIQETGLLTINDENYLYDVLLGALRRLDVNDTTDLDYDFQILGAWDPFFETGILEAANYYSNLKQDDYYAYNFLVNASYMNPYSVKLNQKIIELSLKMGLIDYALDGLENLRALMKENEFNKYEKEITFRVREKQAQRDIWIQ